MVDQYLDIPPPPDQRIETLHVWIATHEDGSEGIMSADIPMPGNVGMRHILLMSSTRERAVAMGPLWPPVSRRTARSQPGS